MNKKDRGFVMSNSFETAKEKPQILLYVKALCISLIASLILILLFAFLLKIFDIGYGWILPVNIVIKIVSIFIGCIIATSSKKHGIRKGIIFGFMYIILAYVLFSLLAGDFSFSIKFLYDVLFGIIAGAICGIIAVNIRK